ncbi:hypothetical protein P7K49_005162 [Saguinus oedipus]|uniref:Uncharacterized protein n=1 Tax=Saguinus oedipus TaxID=9490 RepID=A0ABQ9WA05_SAGOE|nr:hypothetical protein P7K49_005162 [Saguinus oedipus]
MHGQAPSSLEMKVASKLQGADCLEGLPVVHAQESSYSVEENTFQDTYRLNSIKKFIFFDVDAANLNFSTGVEEPQALQMGANRSSSSAHELDLGPLGASTFQVPTIWWFQGPLPLVWDDKYFLISRDALSV